MMQADRGLQELLDSVDTVIVIPNEKLLAVAKDAGFFESFRIADDVLRQGVQGISDIITIPGVINRDFADVKTTMAGMGYAVMGTAMRSGGNRASEAAMAAMASPLLESGAIDGARGILINITGSSNLKLSEVNEASSIIQSAAHEDANIIFGAVQDDGMGDEIKITVIATGFRQQEMPERRERMLAETTMPGTRYEQQSRYESRQQAEVRIQPRVETQRAAPVQPVTAAPARTAAPEPERYASLEPVKTAEVRRDAEPAVRPSEPQTESWRSERASAADAGRTPQTGAEMVARTEVAARTEAGERGGEESRVREAAPQLLPVRASVFDDDFFRERQREVVQSGEAPAASGRAWEMRDPSSQRNVQHDALRAEVFHVHAAEEPSRAPSQGTADGTRSDPDELDIPAFLRRGN